MQSLDVRASHKTDWSYQQQCNSIIDMVYDSSSPPASKIPPMSSITADSSSIYENASKTEQETNQPQVCSPEPYEATDSIHHDTRNISIDMTKRDLTQDYSNSKEELEYPRPLSVAPPRKAHTTPVFVLLFPLVALTCNLCLLIWSTTSDWAQVQGTSGSGPISARMILLPTLAALIHSSLKYTEAQNPSLSLRSSQLSHIDKEQLLFTYASTPLLYLQSLVYGSDRSYPSRWAMAQFLVLLSISWTLFLVIIVTHNYWRLKRRVVLPKPLAQAAEQKVTLHPPPNFRLLAFNLLLQVNLLMLLIFSYIDSLGFDLYEYREFLQMMIIAHYLLRQPITGSKLMIISRNISNGAAFVLLVHVLEGYWRVWLHSIPYQMSTVIIMALVVGSMILDSSLSLYDYRKLRNIIRQTNINDC